MNESPQNLLTVPARNFRRRHPATPTSPSTSKVGATSKVGTGALGESLAEKFLTAKGYSIRTRNYRIRGGEMDIVAKKGGIIVFVEVKTRRGSRFGEAFEAIDRRKKQRLLRVIRRYLSDEKVMVGLPPYTPWRCDLIAIDLKAAQIRHYKNIFLN